MKKNIELRIPKNIESNIYSDDLITLVLKSADTVSVIWEGKYQERTITVTLPNSSSAEFAKIKGAEDLGLDDQIISEIKKIY